MKVQLAKIKAEQEKTGKKSEHKVSAPSQLLSVRFAQAHIRQGELQEGRRDVEECVRSDRALALVNAADL
jgi:hypothetical protein